MVHLILFVHLVWPFTQSVKSRWTSLEAGKQQTPSLGTGQLPHHLRFSKAPPPLASSICHPQCASAFSWLSLSSRPDDHTLASLPSSWTSSSPGELSLRSAQPPSHPSVKPLRHSAASEPAPRWEFAFVPSAAPVPVLSRNRQWAYPYIGCISTLALLVLLMRHMGGLLMHARTCAPQWHQRRLTASPPPRTQHSTLLSKGSSRSRSLRSPPSFCGGMMTGSF
mmetsp:Transcript_32663/g.43414  ORF Transcript_32663/g.43414 Transcript_32663/m.43414 type:complete len:223 (-) Transcript_32663:213-881(-)